MKTLWPVLGAVVCAGLGFRLGIALGYRGGRMDAFWIAGRILQKYAAKVSWRRFQLAKPEPWPPGMAPDFCMDDGERKRLAEEHKKEIAALQKCEDDLRTFSEELDKASNMPFHEWCLREDEERRAREHS